MHAMLQTCFLENPANIDFKYASTLTSASKSSKYWLTYRLLGLPAPHLNALNRPAWDCTSSDISKAYRKLSALVHPDKNPQTDARLAFEALNKAHRALRDPGTLVSPCNCLPYLLNWITGSQMMKLVVKTHFPQALTFGIFCSNLLCRNLNVIPDPRSSALKSEELLEAELSAGDNFGRAHGSCEAQAGGRRGSCHPG